MLRGLTYLLVACAGVGLLAALAIDAWRFEPAFVIGARTVSYLTLAAALVLFVGIPLFARVTDTRLALYVEEHEPTLGMALASATELQSERSNSSDLERGVLEQALTACRRVDRGRRVDGSRLQRAGWVLAAVVLGTSLLALIVPSNLRSAIELLLFPQMSAAAVNPYRLSVEPGDVLVAKGADQLIIARIEGFEPETVQIFRRFGPNESWRRSGMVPRADPLAFEILLFDIDQTSEYYVTAGGLRSEIHAIEVMDVPTVRRIDLTYHYPPRLGLPPRQVIDGGDIRAVHGSRVEVTAVPSQDVPGASLVLDGRERVPLSATGEGGWSTSLAVNEEGHYRIELAYGDEPKLSVSENYAIEVISDGLPSVDLTRPGRDVRVTSVEEFLIEATAHDDLSVGRLELVYSVNGGSEQTVVLDGGTEVRNEVAADHTLYLENFGLIPGDLIAYYARASDAVSDDAQQATTDIFFMEIRPFERDFRSAAAGGGGLGGGNQERSLSAQQRQFVIASFKLLRDKSTYSEERFADTASTLGRAQARIRDRVEAIVRRLGARNIMQGHEGFQRMRRELPEAIKAMRAAEAAMINREPATALPPAREALQHLQRAEAAFRDVQVSLAQQSGGAAATDAEDLANLFQLEMDKMRNQYENVQRGKWRPESDELDDVLAELRELANRQQKELERLRRRADLSIGAPDSGGSQGALADEVAEVIRRLERLSREQPRPELDNLINQARAAARAMRRAASSEGAAGVRDARAALDRLEQAQQRTEEERRTRLQREIANTLEKARRLAEEQGDMQAAVRALPEENEARKEVSPSLKVQKFRMAEQVRELESELGGLAREAKEHEKAVAQGLRRANEGMREGQVRQKILRSASAIDDPSRERSERLEAEISESLENLSTSIALTAERIGESRSQQLARSLNQTRALVRELESLEEQIRRQADAPSSSRSSDPTMSGRVDGQSRWVGRFSTADIERFQHEFSERRSALESMGEVLSRDEHGARDISTLLERMQELERADIYQDPQELLERQASLIAALKDFEFRLRHDLGNSDPHAPLVTGDDAVPAEYRPLVEEYFRDLSRAGND